MLRIELEGYRSRVESLQSAVGQAGLDLFIVSAFESIYYLTGAGFEPLERPFFLLVRPSGASSLLVPKLDHVFYRPPSTEAKQAFDAMMEARRIAFELIRPGMACSELDGCVNEFLRKEGYGSEEQRLHRTGHGFGLGNHEAPWIAEGSEDRIAENMVISIEPGIYLAGIGGVRHSDTVLVTNDSFRLLTHCPMDLGSLVIRQWKPVTRAKGWLVRRALGLALRTRLKK